MLHETGNELAAGPELRAIDIAANVAALVLSNVRAATDHRRQCSCANLARGANSKGSQQAPFAKRKGCPTA